jgi:putative membrane protein
MSTAFVFSCLFLVTYITNHALHGDMRFQGPEAIRYVYFPLLISHIGLSVLALPMILITFFLSLSGRFPAHRRLARFTFPIWLYVSVTGVIVCGLSMRQPAGNISPLQLAEARQLFWGGTNLV